MISLGYLKKTIFISLLGHITVFSIFSFSFGNRIPIVNYSNVYFWGGILDSYDFISQEAINKLKIKTVITRPPDVRLELKDKTNTERPFRADYYFKPVLNLVFNRDKIIFAEERAQMPLKGLAKESVVVFHPVLPYHFTLYFKDRQRVHIELMFDIVSSGRNTNSIVVKRKIASGNLEVDLLSMRYLSHYLFIQQARFIPDKWQTVKIEFSPRPHD